MQCGEKILLKFVPGLSLHWLDYSNDEQEIDYEKLFEDEDSDD